MAPPLTVDITAERGPGLFPAMGLFVADCMFWQLDVAVLITRRQEDVHAAWCCFAGFFLSWDGGTW